MLLLLAIAIIATRSYRDGTDSAPRFVVLDLAVDPPTYGPMNDMAGAVDALTIPTIPPLYVVLHPFHAVLCAIELTLDPFHGSLPELRASNADRSLPRESDRHFQAHLATIVHTAVRHVFSNDMLFSLQPIPNRVRATYHAPHATRPLLIDGSRCDAGPGADHRVQEPRGVRPVARL